MFNEATLTYISTNPDMAKTVVRSLEKEVIRLQASLAKLENFDGETGLLEEVDEWLAEKQLENEILKRKLYGRSSEKRKPHGENDSEKDGESQQEGEESQSDKKKRKKPECSGRGEVGKGLPLFSEEYELEWIR